MDKKFVGLVTLFFLTFGIFSAVVVFNKPLTQMTRAKEDVVASATNSLIFAWPITVKADGKSMSTITVFARTSSDKPLANKSVTVTTTLGELKESAVTTDNQGKALFLLNSQEKGTAEVGAVINGDITLSSKVSVKFE